MAAFRLFTALIFQVDLFLLQVVAGLSSLIHSNATKQLKSVYCFLSFMLLCIWKFDIPF